MTENNAGNQTVYFRRITAATVYPICLLSETLSPNQRKMVADNAISIAQAHFSENAWIRAIYLDEEPIGFIMLHFGFNIDDGILCPGAFLWRFMIASPYQGKGYGKIIIHLLTEQLNAQGYKELYTSTETGKASPLEFYKRLGFVQTGDYLGEEVELVLKW